MGVSISRLKNGGDAQEQWVDYCDGLRLLVRPMGSRDYDRNLQLGVRKDRRAMRSGDSQSADALEKLAMKAASETILVGWEGLVDDDGQGVPYSAETALSLFQANYKFYKDVVEIATDMSQTALEALEAERGN